MTRRLGLLLLLAFVSFSQIFSSDEDTILYESFDEGSFIVSTKHDYKGVWKREKSDLLVSEKAKKYIIVKELDELKDETVVLQFETRLQNGLECEEEEGWIPKEFDKCGVTNKVILKHKNPKTGEYVEHHLKYPPSVPSDKRTHVYTAILKPNNDLHILVDGEENKKANFLSSEDFEPPLIPPKTIPDPDDKKPEDWDERAKIPDPDAKNYKGKWHAPLIDNPAYKGIWKPQEIPNPDFFQLDQLDFAAIRIEIWTMQDGILFDNILINKDEKVATSIRESTWKPRFLAEAPVEVEQTAIGTLLVYVAIAIFLLFFMVAGGFIWATLFVGFSNLMDRLLGIDETSTKEESNHEYVMVWRPALVGVSRGGRRRAAAHPVAVVESI